MDKKKVKELIEDATCKLNYFDEEQDNYEGLRMDIVETLEQVVKELSKSDWISVEDRLPEFGEKVYVRSERSPDLIQTCREDFDEEDGKIHPFRNKDKFVLEHGIYGNITHWKPIEKLEE